jgi:hypothetical protein
VAPPKVSVLTGQRQNSEALVYAINIKVYTL